MPIIEVEDLSKTFYVPRVRRETVREHVFNLFRRQPADALKVLEKVSFSVNSGEMVAVIGRNGCGKSTLLKLVSSIFPPDSGRITVRGGVTPILELGVGWNPELDA